MSKKGRVLMAMSGGIDSSLAALMLHEEGYEVIGITMKTWDYAHSGGNKKETGCCSLDSINDARSMAVKMGFPHYILDIREEFGEKIIDYFSDEYLAGRTPNPCVMCNTYIKWDLLLRRADKLDCEFMATGHYAKINNANGRYYITRGNDLTKDQSYVLWGLSQDSLKRTLFPLADFEKTQTRAMAADKGFIELANKPESYDICFVPDNDYRGFLKRRIEGLTEMVKNGEFVDTQGKVLGKHEGYPFYTIGQRKGLGIATGEPVYVVEISKDKNQVVLSDENGLYRNGLTAHSLNLQKYASLENGFDNLITKIRYKDEGQLSHVVQNGDTITVKFNNPVKAIAPGQAAVFYEGDDVVGGGWINNSFNI